MDAITKSVQRMTVSDREHNSPSQVAPGCRDSDDLQRQNTGQSRMDITSSTTGHVRHTKPTSSIDTLVCAMTNTGLRNLDLPLAFYITIHLRLANTTADIAKPQLMFGSWSWAATFANLWSWTLASYSDDGARDIRQYVTIGEPIGIAFQLEKGQYRAKCAANDLNIESRYQAFLVAAEVAGEKRRREMIQGRVEGTVDPETDCYCFEAAVSGDVMVYYEDRREDIKDWGERWDKGFEQSGLPF